MKNGFCGSLIICCSLLSASCLRAEEVNSYAIVKDNGLLRIRGQLYRLDGIYVPRINSLCDSFVQSRGCEIGNVVQALNEKIRGFVRCVDHSVNGDGTLNAYCSFQGDDLGAFLVRNGYAMAAANAPFEYFSLQDFARHQGRGLWMTLQTPGIQPLY